MRFISYVSQDDEGVGVASAEGYRGLSVGELGSDLAGLIAAGPSALAQAGERLSKAPVLVAGTWTLLPPLPRPGKIICIGLNYVDHSVESGFEPPTYPTVFTRFANSLVAHGAPIVRPTVSEQLDFEGELVVVIGRRAKAVAATDALACVAGYSIFNDGSIRDYQFKSPQWTMGKTFDGTGGFGPEFVTADELPPGCKGLKIETRLNGAVVQSATTADMIFDVATLIAILSEVMTLDPGDVIVSGTPSGVGFARKPPLWMKPGDVCEIEIEGVGLLSNPVQQQPAA